MKDNTLAAGKPDRPPCSERLAFTISESAALIGVSRISLYRLIARGLIKPSGALRHKLIAKTELQRFLKETETGVAA